MMTNEKAMSPPDSSEEAGGWTFLSNHSHVLVCLARNPQVRLRDVALQVGITERAVQRIIAELERGGFITRQRRGRTNRYRIHGDRHLRHPIEANHTVDELLRSIVPEDEYRPATGTNG